jgi:type I restriction enzyme S subunit
VLPPSGSYEDYGDVTLIRATELGRDLKINLSTSPKVPREYFKHKRAQVQVHDILLAVKGATIASEKCVCFVQENVENAIVNGSIFRMKAANQISPKYLAYVLDSPFAKRQMKVNLIANNAVDYLDLPLIHNLLIPIPAINIQEEVVLKLDETYTGKRAKEAEARRLLESVDAYLLERLGITLPAMTDTTLGKRIFYATSGVVLGGRFDAPSHSFTLSFKSETFPMIRFKDYVEINPYTSLAHLPGETPLSFVPMESISDLYGEIRGTQTRAAGEAKGYTLFREGDVLWAKITPCMQNGKSAIAEDLLNGFGFGSTEYHVFRAANDEVNPSYIHALLRLKHLRNEATKFFSGSAGHQRVDADLFKRLSIPLPPLGVQDEIVAHVGKVYAEAKRLRREGLKELEAAKREVEAMILNAPAD